MTGTCARRATLVTIIPQAKKSASQEAVKEKVHKTDKKAKESGGEKETKKKKKKKKK